MSAEDRKKLCPGCGHRMGRHSREMGCEANWGPYVSGQRKTPGCECPLALAGLFGPPASLDLLEEADA